MSTASTADRKVQDKPRRLLQLGAMGLLSGIAICALGLPSIGGWLATASAVALVIGIHTFGRLGPDSAQEPAQAAPEVAKKRKKNRRKATSHAAKRSAIPDEPGNTSQQVSQDTSDDS